MLPSTTSPSDSRRLINQPPPPSAAKNPQFLTNRPSKRESSSVFRCTRGIKRDSSRSARPRCLEFRLKNEIPRPRDRRQGDSPHTWRGDSRNAATGTGGEGGRGSDFLTFLTTAILVRAIPWFRCRAKALKPRDVRIFGEKEIAFEVTLAGRWDIGYVARLKGEGRERLIFSSRAFWTNWKRDDKSFSMIARNWTEESWSLDYNF